MNKQVADYYKAIADINKIIEKNRDRSKKDYSSSWIDDLIGYFGIEFVKKNRDVIIQAIMAICLSDEENFEHKLKDLIYIEAMLFGSYKDYYGKFLYFYKEELGQNAQKKVESHKDIAENFLALIDKVSLTCIYNTAVLKNVLAENKARKLNDEVYTFLKAHPLSHTFGNSEALGDLEKVIDK